MNIINNTSLDLLTIKHNIMGLHLYKIYKNHNGFYEHEFVVNNKKYVARVDYHKYKIVVDYVKE